MTVTSAVCMIAKNEGPYLVEWIAHYRLLGFDQVIIYENNSDDNSVAILSALAEAGKIIYRPWKLGAKESPQITAYQDCLRRIRTDWILFVDCDEFLVLHHHERVHDFLQTFDSQPAIGAIGINWRVFGANGQTENDGRLVMERFDRAAEIDFAPNRHLKSFLRVSKVGRNIHMHVSQTSGQIVHASGRELHMKDWGLSDFVELDVAQINHYYTKSLAEYQVKKRRGQGGAGDNEPQLKYWYSDDVFHAHDRNDVHDASAEKFLDAVREEVANLKAVVAAFII